MAFRKQAAAAAGDGGTISDPSVERRPDDLGGRPSTQTAEGLGAESEEWGVWRRGALVVALGLGFPVAGLGVWQALVAGGALSPTFFPPPWTIASEVVYDLTSTRSLSQLSSGLEVTLGVLGVGYAIGALSGVIIGTMMGVWRLARLTLSPTLHVVYALPMIALYPLSLILFGLGNWSTIATCALGTFFIVCISTLSGVAGRNPLYDEIGQVFQIPKRLRYTHVVLPGALPTIMSGLKLGLAQGLIIVLSIEFIGSTSGMGAYIWNAWQSLEVGQMFVGLFLILIVAGAIVILGNIAERASTPWARR